MKTLHIETGRHLYGGPRQVLELLDGLKARGIGATLACPAESAIAAAAAEAGHEVVTHPISGDLDISAITFLTRTVQRLKPDLLHAHSRRGADFFGGLAASLAGVPAVLTRRVDNPDTPVVGSLKYLAYDRVVAISDAVRAQLEGQGVPPAKLRTIRSAINADACQPTFTRAQFLAEFGLEESQRVVAVVAQLIPRKGHALLLDAWPLIRHRCPDARLLVFGSGPLDADLRSRTGLGGTVTFAGFRPDLRQFLGRIDLLVHPASREALGVSLLEAQAAGVPVVACATGGVPEVVADGVTGLLVPKANPAALAEAVIRLLDDPNLRQQFGTAATARIRADFSPDRMVEDYLTVYRELLT
ncbi:MAG: glycosyltransferase family 4 protein [Gallionellaceae bacterium]|nr:glycosyltransferase family 4 protein [Gallionellaceae bacterium]